MRSAHAGAWLALLFLLLSALGSSGAATGREGTSGGTSEHDVIVSCAQLGARLATNGLWLLEALTPDGPDHCVATLKEQRWASEGGGPNEHLAWSTTLRVHRQALQAELQHREAHGGLWGLLREEPLAAGVQMTNLLCMPRIAMLWSLAKQKRLAQYAEQPSWLQLLRPGHDADQQRASEEQQAEQRQHQQQRQQQARQQLAAVQLLQHLLALRSSGRDVRLALPDALRAAGLASSEQQLMEGAGWGAWLLWLLCPGLLVSHWAVANSAGHPWFALYICALGLLRTAFETFALRMALSRGRLSRADKLDSLFCSHVLPAALNGLLAGLQALTTPFMPEPMSHAVFWLRCLLLPPISLWVLFSSWVPLDDVPPGGVVVMRTPSRSGRRRGQAQDAPGAQGDGVVAVAGAAPAAATPTKTAPVMHWPPPLQVPHEIDELPPEQVPEAFRCPITLGIMHEPTQSTSGITFERVAIAQWLEGHRHDPVTHAPLRRRHLSPNLCLRSVMEAWMADKAEELARQRGGAHARPAAEHGPAAPAEAVAVVAQASKKDQ